jgi:xanthine dehydrogenase accessory factor
VPGEIRGVARARVLRAPADGEFRAERRIGETVCAGDVLGRVGAAAVCAGIGGILRGLIRSGTPVAKGLKIGDIDPRGDPGLCGTISDKARAISGSVLEAVLRTYNR